MLLHLRIHVIPRLRAGGEYIHHGSVGRWIVQAPRLQSEGIWSPFRHQDYLAAAIWAKPALGCKVSDEFTVPLCRGHHREVHHSGDEVAWWKKMGIDPLSAARTLWLETHQLQSAKVI